jgi:hypothetical protein
LGSCIEWHFINNNGFGLADYVDYTNCYGIPSQVIVSDGGDAYICVYYGETPSWSYSDYPEQTGPCSY